MQSSTPPPSPPSTPDFELEVEIGAPLATIHRTLADLRLLQALHPLIESIEICAPRPTLPRSTGYRVVDRVQRSSDELRPLDAELELELLTNDPELPRLLKGSDKAVSIGVDYDLVSVNGKAWETRGHRERGWLFGSSKSFGSDRDFLQAYVSTRRSYLKGERWKFIVRAEAGYSEAKVDNYDLTIDGRIVPLSATTLPNFYRFKAGGSDSVRGYGFEELSNNHIGSNHLVSASAEVEMKFLEKWSVALFFDIGNAFNDWSAPELKKGVGVGVRWYSIAGPIRVDVAQALDLVDRPWRLHFTIGTTLL